MTGTRTRATTDEDGRKRKGTDKITKDADNDGRYTDVDEDGRNGNAQARTRTSTRRMMEGTETRMGGTHSSV